MTDVALPPPPAAALPPPPAAVAPPPAPAVARPRLNLDPATRRQSFIVAGVIATLFFGSQILNEALPSGGNEVRPGNPIAIGQKAQITPLEGWLPSARDNGGVRLEKGVVVLDLSAETFGQNAGDLARAYLEQVLQPAATQLTATDVETATTANGSAARFSYQGIFGGTAIEGEVTTVFAGGQGVIADAWTLQGSLNTLLGEVHQMLETIEVTP